MFFRSLVAAASLGLVPHAAQATSAMELLVSLKVPEVIEIMREEGLAYGVEMQTDFLGGLAGSGWGDVVGDIYDTDRMLESVHATFSATLADDAIIPLMAFFNSDTGQQIVSLELGARAAMTDADVDEEARAAYRAQVAEDDPRLAQLEAFVSANDLIEENVAGALNANYQFYQGLVDGGGLEMSEADMLSEVWSQEEVTRLDTTEWLYAYLGLAYGPLDPDVLDSYIEISSTPEGRALNRALFTAFNQMYDEISYALGFAAAREMTSQDL